MAHQHKYAQMPQILQDIAEAAGAEAAAILAQTFGGGNLYIPAHIEEAQWLADLIGEEAAEKLISRFTYEGYGVTCLIPMGTRALKQKKLTVLLAQGLSPQAAARRAGVHMRTAYRLRRRLARDDRQIDIEDYLAEH